MVASKRIHCAICDKKCSGKVLRYQDQYYHKQCFELEQSEGKRQEQQYLATTNDSTSTTTIVSRSQTQNPPIRPSSQQQQQQTTATDEHQQSHQRASSKSHQILYSSSSSNNNNNNSTPESMNQRQLDGDMSAAAAELPRRHPYRHQNGTTLQTYGAEQRGQTLDARTVTTNDTTTATAPARSATLPHSNSSPANGFPHKTSQSTSSLRHFNTCAGCKSQIKDGQALIALDLHWHVWCFKCAHCKVALHGEYVAKEGRAYCEKDYQKLFGVTCVYCKRYITGKVLQAGEAHHFHPSCARCSKCGDPFVPGEEMYLQGEVTWHPRCGPGPESSSAAGAVDDSIILGGDPASNKSQLRSSRAQSPSLSSRSHSRSASPFSFMSRQYGRVSPGYTESEALGDLSRVYTISYLNADPTQGYLRRPIEPMPPKSPQFSRPTSATRHGDRSSRSSTRSQYYAGGAHRERSVPRGMYSVLSSMRSDSSNRARSPSMMNEEAIHMAQYPSGQKPGPDTVPAMERDDFPAPPFPYPDRTTGGGGVRSSSASRSNVNEAPATERHLQTQKQPLRQPAAEVQQQQRASRPRSREIVINDDDDDENSSNDDPQLTKEEAELSKIANGIGKIFLQTLKEREKLRAWKRANLDPRNASRTPSATRELPSRLRYDNPTNASPSRDMDRPRPWEEDETGAATSDHSPNRTRSSLGRPTSSSNYGYKVVQSNRSTPRPGYGLSAGPYESVTGQSNHTYINNNNNSNSNGFNGGQLEGKHSELSFNQQQRIAENRSNDLLHRAAAAATGGGATLQSDIIKSASSSRHLGGVSAHLRRSMPNVDHLHQDGPPKLYPYHLLATSNYRLPPDVDRCHLERHLSNEEFQYIFHCDRLDFYRLPAWKRNELKRRVKLF